MNNISIVTAVPGFGSLLLEEATTTVQARLQADAFPALGVFLDVYMHAST